MNSRKSTVFVSKEDKDKLQKSCQEIKTILEKYPSSNDYSEQFITTMSRVKNYFSFLNEWIDYLDVVEK